MQCLSTHGGAGYAPWSYWDGDEIVCGMCGAHFPPSQAFPVPLWVMGERGVPWVGKTPREAMLEHGAFSASGPPLPFLNWDETEPVPGFPGWFREKVKEEEVK